MGSSRLQRRTGMAFEMLQFVVVVVVTLLAFWVQYKTTKKFALLQVQESLEAQNEKPISVSGANEETKDTDSQFGVAESDVKKKEDTVSNVLTDENEQTQESNAEKENHGDEGTRSGDGEPAVEKVKDVIGSIFAKGIVLGKDAVKKAKKSNQLMNEKVRGLDEKLHVSEKLFSGASLVASALNGVAKAATDIGEKTKDKVLAAEEQQSKLEGGAGTHGTEDTRSHDAVFSVEKVKDVFSRTVSKGFILGEDALKKAKSFTQNNQFTSTTAGKVASAYQKIGLYEKISASKIVINDKMRGIDENLHVSEKLLSAASLVTSSLNGVAKAATEIGQKTKVEGCAGTHGTEDTRSHDAEFSVEKVKDVFSRTVSKGFVLGEDALKKAKSFTQNNQFTSTTAAKVASAYEKIGLNEKISASKIVINDKMRGIGENLHVSEKISTGASLVTGALKGIAKRAGKIGQKTEEK